MFELCNDDWTIMLTDAEMEELVEEGDSAPVAARADEEPAADVPF